VRSDLLCDGCRKRVRQYQRELYAVAQLQRTGHAAWLVSATATARRLDRLREAGWTYAKLSAETGIPRSTLCRVVTSTRRRQPVRVSSDVERAVRMLQP
jgi:hypothetical protein